MRQIGCFAAENSAVFHNSHLTIQVFLDRSRPGMQSIRYLTVRYMFFKVTLQSNAALFVSLDKLVIIRITY